MFFSFDQLSVRDMLVGMTCWFGGFFASIPEAKVNSGVYPGLSAGVYSGGLMGFGALAPGSGRQ